MGSTCGADCVDRFARAATSAQSGMSQPQSAGALSSCPEVPPQRLGGRSSSLAVCFCYRGRSPCDLRPEPFGKAMVVVFWKVNATKLVAMDQERARPRALQFHMDGSVRLGCRSNNARTDGSLRRLAPQ